ncbi:MAG: hypothetical protein P9X24_00880 [Candidatus Hatepunaea meridiana]|nr:hypothetical protein [Candidatus Hatepunaea meridiana]
MTIPKEYIGKWFIDEMDLWDRDFIDLVVPGHFTFREDGTGTFQFGAVYGEMDCRIGKTEDRQSLEFSWDGSDECDSASGRGWVEIVGNQIKGHIYLHLGDDSGFTASIAKNKKMKRQLNYSEF